MYVCMYVCMYIKYIKNSSYKNLFFSFLFHNSLTVKLDGNAFAKEKTLFSLLEIFYIFSKRLVLTKWNGMDKAQFSW